MKEGKKCIPLAPSRWCFRTIALAGCLVLSVAAVGQDLPTSVSTPVPQLPAVLGAQLRAQLPPYEGKTGNRRQADASLTPTPGAASSKPVTTSTGARIITLQEAQQKAAPAGTNPLVRLGQLQVEVARQTRLGTQSSFFPQIGSAFDNLHFNRPLPPTPFSATHS